MATKNNGERWWTGLFDRLNNLAYQDLFLIWIAAVTIFGIIYFGLSFIPGEGPRPLMGDVADHFLNALYYSVITATNTGYGDILPYGFSRFFAALESVAGLFVFAVFITKLMSRRQDVALKEIHKLTFENTFHHLRENLHVVRKDFDAVIAHAHNKKEVRKEDYQRIALGYEQCANVINELPSFYKTASGLYRIDQRRETLMIEAVHRTLSRILLLIDALSEENIVWINDEVSVARLRDLVHVVESCVSEWSKRSTYNHTTDFEEILHLGDRIKGKIEKQLANG